MIPTWSCLPLSTPRAAGRRSRALLAALALALAAPACSDDADLVDLERAEGGPGERPADAGSVETALDAGHGHTHGDDASADGGGDGDGDSSGGGDTSGEIGDDVPPAPAGRPAARGIAVVHSDRTSTSVAQLALDGSAVVRERCFGSGSGGGGLSAALSGDVVLPSQTQPGNELVLVDRKNGVITWLEPGSCQPLRQLNTGSGWASNPQDLVAGLPGGKGYVLRYDQRPGDASQGSDLLIIDTASARARGRIPLQPHTSQVPGASPILPRPSRAVAVEGRVFVVLTSLSADYNAAGGGRVVVVDAERDQVVEVIDLPGLKNCSSAQLIEGPAGARTLAVGCGGLFGDGPAQIVSAGVALIDVGGAHAHVQVIPSTPFPRPVSAFDVALLPTPAPGVGFTVLIGDGANVHDEVWLFDLAGAAPPRKVHGAEDTFVTALTGDPARQQLYLLDASPTQPRVHVLGPSGTRLRTLDTSATVGLPPRSLAFY